jgi:uncharacterized membrane protein
MAKKQDNANIIALGFNSLDGAENMLDNIHVWQERGYFTVKDAVVVVRGSGANQLEIKQTVKKTGKWALGGGGIGFLAGMLLGGPIGGLIVGTTVGAISGALKDSGIDDNFIHVIGTTLRGDTSALLVMVEPNPNRNEEEFMKELSEQRATILSTTLSSDREQQLRRLLSGSAATVPSRARDQAAPPAQPTDASAPTGPEASPEESTQLSTEEISTEESTATVASDGLVTETQTSSEMSTGAGMEAVDTASPEPSSEASVDAVAEASSENSPEASLEANPEAKTSA